MKKITRGKNTKILLVNTKPEQPVNIWGPALGLCYLSSYLKSKGYTNISGIDLNVDSEKELKEELSDADIVGICCFTNSLGNSLHVAKLAKQNDSIVVLGGPHPTLCPEEVLENENVDFVIISEGEVRFYKLVDSLVKNQLKKINEIDGIGHKPSGRVTVQEKKSDIKDLDSLPFPDRTIFKLDRYKARHVTILASRGCPYRCTNCQPALTKVAGVFRTRSTDNVIKEIKEIVNKYHTNMLSFVDNDVTINRKWIEEFCRKVIEMNLDTTWQCQGRVNTLDRGLMALMKEAGCDYIGLGIESGSQEVIDKILLKGIDLERAKQVVDEARELEIPLHTFFIIGIPGETKKDIEKTIDFASRINSASVGFSIGTPWPDSGFYLTSKAKSWLLFKSWTELHQKRRCYIKTDDFTPDDIERYRNKIYELFKGKGWLAVEYTFQFFNPHYDKSLLKRLVKTISFRFLSISQIRFLLRAFSIKKSS